MELLRKHGTRNELLILKRLIRFKETRNGWAMRYPINPVCLQKMEGQEGRPAVVSAESDGDAHSRTYEEWEEEQRKIRNRDSHYCFVCLRAYTGPKVPLLLSFVVGV